MFVTHSFRDPIHGFIRLSTQERALVDSPVFQRLRRIRQLGTGSLIYHGAEHSRFGHSLGVMEVATRVFKAILRSRPDLIQSREEAARTLQILRLSALLHDLGHAPFSHASDEIFPRDEVTKKQFKHEDYSEALILSSEIGEIIDSTFTDLDVSAKDVVNVYSEDPAVLGAIGVLMQDIVAGELDADRMDYLARDSMYAGVAYGRYDLERLLDTVTAVEDRDGTLHLAVEDGGLYALEEFLLARYYMFQQVYLNEQRRFYDRALMNVVKALRADSGGEYPPPSQWREFVSMDDVWLLSRLPELISSGNIWASSLFHRRHWKVVSSLDTSDPSQDQVRWAQTERDTSNHFGPDVVVADDARGKTFQRTDPGPYISSGAEKTERPQILVLSEDRTKSELVERRSQMVAQLGARRIRIMRVYARPERFDDVKAYWADAASKNG